MKPKQIFRAAVDCAMTALLLALMAYMLTGQELHEWLGAGMLALFLAHLILNAQWLRNVGRGKYTPYRVLQTLLVLLVLAALLGSMVSGIMMSRYVFGFLPIHGGMAFARSLHMLSSYWGFLLMSAHLGLHWGTLLAMARRAAGIQTASPPRAAVLRLLACGTAAYGVYAFARHRIADYLFLRSQFVFFDFEQPPLQFFGEYLAMMGLWIFLSYYLGRLLQKAAFASKKQMSAPETDRQEEMT